MKKHKLNEHGGLCLKPSENGNKILDFSVNINPLKYKGKNLKNLLYKKY